jgi:MerR family mercuric resistance operon transcriptional regulator
LRLQFIKNAKELGFSLKEISEFLSLRVNPKTTCAEVKKYAGIKIADIDEKIKNLKQIKKALVKLSARCTGRGSTDECPILEALNGQR